METSTRRYHWFTAITLLLILPAAYFIAANILNEFGISVFYKTIDPFIPRQIGWNINLLILFGPLLALLISLFQVLGIHWHFTKEHFDIHITIQRKWLPISVALFSGLILGTLFIYLVGENF